MEIEWAYTENESKKSAMNRKIYEEIKGKAEVKYIKSGYAHKVYEVVSNPNNLSTLELALICDNGNLCYGHRTQGLNIVINTD